MRIAQIAPLIERVPPKKYGGTERVISALTEELVKRGHRVILFASGDSLTSAKLISVYPKSLREAKLTDVYGANYFTMLNIGQAYSRQYQFDIIHDHSAHLSLPTANIAQSPVVMTMHGQIDPNFHQVFKMLNKPNLVAISHCQKNSATDLNWAGVVHNGLEMEHYPFSDSDGGYLLFVGRISMEKGVHHAIEVAQFLDLPLIIAAKLESYDVPYFKEYIEPKLSDQIRWIGEVNEAERNKLMSRAMAFLHPATWKEPFGLTLIEAAACGCPVIAFNKGSIPEIVIDGKTGFVVEDVKEMIEAVAKVHLIKRAICREYVLEVFSATRMAEGYEHIYEQILNKKHALWTPAYAHQLR